MNYYLISFGKPTDCRRERNSHSDGSDRAIVVRAEDRLQAIEIARDLLVIADPVTAEAHEVRFPNPDPNMD